MFRKVDCILLHVSDLERALEFYRDSLGHRLAWRRGNVSAGLHMEESDSEIVLVTGSEHMEVDLLVSSVDTAVLDLEKVGGKVIEPPFDIPIGRCAVIEDPWKNELVIVDTSKGLLKTDAKGNVIEPS